MFGIVNVKEFEFLISTDSGDKNFLYHFVFDEN
jgi:hypothetical protein